MRRGYRLIGASGVVWVLLLVAGCNDPKDAQIASLQEENANLTQELASARMSLDASNQDADDAYRRAQGLQEEVDRLRALAEAQPAESEGWQAVPGGARIALPGNVLFDSGKTIVKSSGRSALDSLVRDIQTTYGDKEVFVFGHTDNEPIRKSGWKDNWELSAQRALAVVRYLRERGVTGSRLVAAGCGEFRPTTGNETPDGRIRNRRVEIFAISAGN